MTKDEIIEKLETIVKVYIPDTVNTTEITEATDLLKDLQINSANLVDIILDVEEAFDIEINDDDAEQMMTVGDSVTVIQKNLAA